MKNEFHFSPEIDALPWKRVFEGFSLKLIRGGTDEDTRVLLLRVEPGTLVPKHRHYGEVHALHIAGQRRLIESDQVVGPGSYVYEPGGNVDSWMAVGDEPLIIFLTTRGAFEYIDENGAVLTRSSTASMTEQYQQYRKTVEA